MSQRTLIDAAYDGTVDEVRQLLAAGADPDSIDDDERSPLAAARENDEALPIMRLLIEAGASPSGRDHQHPYPVIMDAMFAGDLELARLIFAKGFRFDSAVEMEECAAQSGHPAMLSLALASAPGDEAVDETVVETDVESVGAGGDGDEAGAIEGATWAEGLGPDRTAALWSHCLAWAARAGRLEAVETILAEHRPTTLAQDLSAHWNEAALGGNPAVLRLLERHGASPGPAARADALGRSAWAGNVPMVEHLLQGATAELRSLAWVAAAARADATLLAFVERDHTPSQLDRDAALGFAAALGREPAVEQLLAGGANPRAPGRAGATPLHQATTAAVALLLLAAGAALDVKDDEGRTPLLTVLSDEVRTLLLERGADVRATDKNGLGVVGHLERQWLKNFPFSDHDVLPPEVQRRVDEMIRRGAKKEHAPERRLRVSDWELALAITPWILGLVLIIAVVSYLADC